MPELEINYLLFTLLFTVLLLYCIMYMLFAHFRVHCSKSTICMFIFALSIIECFSYCLHDDVTMTVFFSKKG
jgi:hypothetical protein